VLQDDAQRLDVDAAAVRKDVLDGFGIQHTQFRIEGGITHELDPRTARFLVVAGQVHLIQKGTCQKIIERVEHFGQGHSLLNLVLGVYEEGAVAGLPICQMFRNMAVLEEMGKVCEEVGND